MTDLRDMSQWILNQRADGKNSKRKHSSKALHNVSQTVEQSVDHKLLIVEPFLSVKYLSKLYATPILH